MIGSVFLVPQLARCEERLGLVEQNLSSTQDQLSARVSEVGDSDWVLEQKTMSFTDIPNLEKIDRDITNVLFIVLFTSIIKI